MSLTHTSISNNPLLPTSESPQLTAVLAYHSISGSSYLPTSNSSQHIATPARDCFSGGSSLVPSRSSGSVLPSVRLHSDLRALIKLFDEFSKTGFEEEGYRTVKISHETSKIINTCLMFHDWDNLPVDPADIEASNLFQKLRDAVRWHKVRHNYQAETNDFTLFAVPTRQHEAAKSLISARNCYQR